MTAGHIERYGVLEQNQTESEADIALEAIRLLGFTTIESDFSTEFIEELRERFECVRHEYAKFSNSFEIEADVIRVLPYFDQTFFRVLFNPRLHQFVKGVLGDYYIVNQVNGVVNPAGGRRYSQAAWHRDLPFRHLTMSRPIAVNALFALDDFTLGNGCTSVIPGSHKVEKFSSDELVPRVEKAVTVKAGTFILLDCMTYHRGGINTSAQDRRAINQAFTIPAWRQQLHLPSIFGSDVEFSEDEKRMLGYGLEEFKSHEEWFRFRADNR